MEQSRSHGVRFGVSITVLGELYFAVYASQRRDRNLQRLDAMLADLLLWPFDERAAREFGVIQTELKARGRPVPASDVQIAAVARLHGLVVLTADQHFRHIANLTIENWLT